MADVTTDFTGVQHAAAGLVGAAFAWIREPKINYAIRHIASMACAGALWGYMAFGILEWRWPTLPWRLSIAVSIAAGMASAALTVLFFKMVDKGSRYVDRESDRRLGVDTEQKNS